MPNNSIPDGVSLVARFSRLRGQNVAAAGGLESTEAVPRDADVPAHQQATVELLCKLVEKYFDNDPKLIEIAKKIVETGGEGLRMLAARDEDALRSHPSALAGLEAIVRTDGSRPSFLIRNGDVDRDSSPLGNWGSVLDGSAEKLRKAIACVGRIDVPGSAAGFQGTGFLIGDDLIITNRHVLQVTARQQNGDWRFPDGAAIDFGHEYRSSRDSVNRRLLKRVLFHGSREIDYFQIDHSKLDLALIELEPVSGAPLNPVYSLNASPAWALPGHRIYTIGYPGSPPSTLYPPTLLEQLFRMTFGYKRLAPGEIIAPQTSVFDWTLAHDATTLGGNSGSVVIVVNDEQLAAGLHYGGRGFEPRENWAHILGSVMDQTDGRSTQTLRKVLESRGVRFTNGPATEIQPRVTRNAIARNLLNPPMATPPGATTMNARPTAVTTLSMNDKSATLSISLTLGDAIATPQETASAAPSVALIEAMRIPIIQEDLESRDGYQPAFLGLDDGRIELPKLTPDGEKIAAHLDDGSPELKYHKFSIVMHKKRRLALFTAANVDWRQASRLINGRKPSRKELSGLGPNDMEQWVTDERIPEAHQLPDLFFTKDGGAFDKGHLIRRDDVCWGPSFGDIQMANGDTYHTTNCSPQVASFNQSAKGEDNWGDLENLVQNQTKAEKAMVFAGPAMADDDPVFVGRDKRGQVRIQIPRKFWKIIVAQTEDGPGAYGFVLEQDLTAVTTEFVVPDQWKRYMCRISEIEDLMNGLVDLQHLKAVDRYDSPDGHGLNESVDTR